MANLFLTGSGVPTNAVGEVTDYYRDTATNLIYYRAALGWEVVPSLVPTPDGVGTHWFYGNGTPSNGIGATNDYYRDDVSGSVYRKNSSNLWEAKGSLDFIGVYGVQWGEGTGAPANIESLNNLPAGSFYLDVSTSDIYYKDNTLTWSNKGQLGNGIPSNSFTTLNSRLNSVEGAQASYGDIVNYNASSFVSTMDLTTQLTDKADLVEGKVPTSQLPSYVDDVLEYANLASFPLLGETSKLYLAINTNLIYRWTGSSYISVTSDLANIMLAVERAEVARDAASMYASTAATAAKYYDTIALGLAGVADTMTFGVKAGGTDGLTRPTIYRRDSVSTYTLIMDQIAGTELPITPVSVEGIIPFVQDSNGRILLGQYLDGTPYPLEVDIAGRARITEVESAIAPVPVSVDGIIPMVQDADGRILLGQYLDGTPYPVEVDIDARARLTIAEATLVPVATLATPLPVSVDGIIPFVQDADDRILLGQYLDGTLVSVATLATPLPVSVDGIIPFVQDADDRILLGQYLDGTPFPAIVIPALNTAYDTLLPADPRLLVSDYRTIVERSPQKLSFIRSITEGNNFKYCSPGSRVGFNTNSLSVKVNVFYNYLVTRLDARNYVGVILADGVEVATFTNPSTNTASATVETLVTFGSVATRKIEIIWPYGDGMELVNIKVVAGSVVTIASARPTNKLLLLGDSITHGYSASKVTASWAYLLCGLKSVQMISEGYGSLTTVGAYGTTAATGSGAYAVTVALGYNDFAAQTALATFQTAYQLILTNIRAALPSAKIYVITPIYSTSTNTIPLSSYRTYIGNAVTAVGDGNTELIDGLSLMTNNSNRLSDGIHPNDTGSAEIATALAAIIT